MKYNKKTLLIFFLLLPALTMIACSKPALPDDDKKEEGTPIEINGKLKVIGTQLCNEKGIPVQLKGMSTHGLQWFSDCLTEDAFISLANEWKCNIIRLALYPEEGGYNLDPPAYKEKLKEYVQYCEDLGVYCLIDWHVLTPGDPNDELYNTADDFFEWASAEFKDKKHVIYEICNEPNGTNVNWYVIKKYANRIIPIIRNNDPDRVIICGTPSWSSHLAGPANDPLPYNNLMYSFHFYAATHYDYNNLSDYLNKVPVFVTEWGTCESNGTGRYDLESASKWLDILDGNNPGKQKVSWTAWTFADGAGTSDVLKDGACALSDFTNLKQPAGQFVFDRIYNANK